MKHENTHGSTAEMPVNFQETKTALHALKDSAFKEVCGDGVNAQMQVAVEICDVLIAGGTPSFRRLGDSAFGAILRHCFFGLATFKSPNDEVVVRGHDAVVMCVEVLSELFDSDSPPVYADALLLRQFGALAKDADRAKIKTLVDRLVGPPGAKQASRAAQAEDAEPSTSKAARSKNKKRKGKADLSADMVESLFLNPVKKQAVSKAKAASAAAAK